MAFNGYVLNYFVDKTFFDKIKANFNINKIKVLDQHKRLCCISFNKSYILPIGLFSNEGFKLSCKFTSTERSLNNQITKKLHHSITLTDIQSQIIQKVDDVTKDIIKNNKSPVYINLVAQCSTGKTVLAIYLILSLKLKAFIVTPNIELAKQWKKEFNKFSNLDVFESLNGYRQLIKNKNIKDFDVIIFPSKHLINKEFNTFLVENYSIGIIDEQHKYNLESNETMIKFFLENTFSYMISLTATPREVNSFYLGRNINLEEILKGKTKTFEKIAYEINIEKYLPFNPTKEYLTYLKVMEKKKRTDKDIRFLNLCKNRSIQTDKNRIYNITNNIVSSFLDSEELVENKSKILILTKFVDEINTYYEEILKKIPDSKDRVFKIFANKKFQEEDLKEVKKKLSDLDKYILIGTEDHLGTGIDIVDLNILHLTSLPLNKRKIIQYAGRISRDNETSKHILYFYNINSFDKYNIKREIKTIIETLASKEWDCYIKTI